jgi:hypothetical protein
MTARYYSTEYCEHANSNVLYHTAVSERVLSVFTQLRYDQEQGFSGPSGHPFTVKIHDALMHWGIDPDASDPSAFVKWSAAIVAVLGPFGAVSVEDNYGTYELNMDAGVMASFFTPVLAAVAQNVASLLAHPAVVGVQ